MLAQADADGGSSGQPSAQSTRPSSLKETRHDSDGPSSSKKQHDVAFSPGRTPTPASLHSAISLERGGPIETYSSSVTPKASVIQLARQYLDQEGEHDHDEDSDEIHRAWRSTSSLPLDDESSPTLAHHQSNERSPLLSKHSSSTAGNAVRPAGEIEEFSKPRSTIWSRLVQHVPNPKDLHRPTGKEVYQHAVVEPVKVIPAVILGLLLNILDGVSYDEFPSSPFPLRVFLPPARADSKLSLF